MEMYHPNQGSERERHHRSRQVPRRRDYFWLRHGFFAVIGVFGSILVFICSSASLWRAERRLPSKIVGGFGAVSMTLAE